MILGIISIILDLLLLNFINFNITSIVIYPMFTITYVISSIYFKKNIKNTLLIFLLYCSFLGVFYLPLAYFLIEYYYIHKDKKNFNKKDFLLKVCYGLILYDLLFYLVVYLFEINYYSLSILVYKILFTLPLSSLYALLFFRLNVLKNKKLKYKLV